MDREEPEIKVYITHHARMRWVQRVADPGTYQHLNTCPIADAAGCEECARQTHLCTLAVNACRSGINTAICKRYFPAVDAGRVVTDESFLIVVRQMYPDRNCKFYEDGRVVFVVIDPAEGYRIPVLTTILSADMIEGTVIRNTPMDQLKSVFDRWKRESRRG